MTLALMTNRVADLEGVFELLAAGGRLKPVFSGYRPGHRLYDNYISSGEHKYIGRDSVRPGSSAEVQVWLITPNVYPKSIWVGRVIDVCEGTKVVGKLSVTRVLNTILLRSPEVVGSRWAEPTNVETISSE